MRFMLLVATLAVFASATAAGGVWRGDFAAVAAYAAAILVPALVVIRLGGLRAAAQGAWALASGLAEGVARAPERWRAAFALAAPMLGAGAKPTLLRRLTPEQTAAERQRLVAAIGAHPGMLVLGEDARGVLVHTLVEGAGSEAELAAIAESMSPRRRR